MGTPTYHAEMSVKRFGGKTEDYIDIHEFMDSSKAAFGDLRHRALTHNSWFVTTVLEKIYGRTITNSDGNAVSVRDIGQFHVMEDFKGNFPSAADFLALIAYQPWMDNAETERPPSSRGLPAPDLDKFYPSRNPKENTGIEILAIESSYKPRERVRGCGGAPGALD